MKLALLLLPCVSAWKLSLLYDNGQTFDTKGRLTSSGCLNMASTEAKVHQYAVDFGTAVVKDPNRVRFWKNPGCKGDADWVSSSKGETKLNEDVLVKSVFVDHAATGEL